MKKVTLYEIEVKPEVSRDPVKLIFMSKPTPAAVVDVLNQQAFVARETAEAEKDQWDSERFYDEANELDACCQIAGLMRPLDNAASGDQVIRFAGSQAGRISFRQISAWQL